MFSNYWASSFLLLVLILSFSTSIYAEEIQWADSYSGFKSCTGLCAYHQEGGNDILHTMANDSGDVGPNRMASRIFTVAHIGTSVIGAAAGLAAIFAPLSGSFTVGHAPQQLPCSSAGTGFRDDAGVFYNINILLKSNLEYRVLLQPLETQ